MLILTKQLTSNDGLSTGTAHTNTLFDIPSGLASVLATINRRLFSPLDERYLCGMDSTMMLVLVVHRQMHRLSVESTKSRSIVVIFFRGKNPPGQIEVEISSRWWRRVVLWSDVGRSPGLWRIETYGLICYT